MDYLLVQSQLSTMYLGTISFSTFLMVIRWLLCFMRCFTIEGATLSANIQQKQQKFIELYFLPIFFITNPYSPQPLLHIYQLFLYLPLARIKSYKYLSVYTYIHLIIPITQMHSRSPDQIVSKKMDEFKALSSALRSQTQRWGDTCSLLFGYLMAHLDYHRHATTIHHLKKQFSILKQQMCIQQLLKNDDAVLIVFQLIQNIKQHQRNPSTFKIEDLPNTLYENMSGMITNKFFMVNKWQKQAQKKIDDQMNQIFIQKMLEEEDKERKKKKMEEERKGWQCQVCCCDIDPAMMGILQCNHIFHPECLNAYLKAQIQDNKLDIRCPLQKCNKKLPPNDIYNFIDGHLKDKFEKFSFNAFVQANSQTSWCPTAGCTAVFESEADLDNYRCPACKKHYCLKCRCIYHVGMTCAEYRINNSFDKNDQKFIDFVKGAKFKQCPKCNYWVQRNQGCSTMKCKCGQEFCYSCGGTGCPHGSCSNSGAKKK